jgi:hypothetical protein
MWETSEKRFNEFLLRIFLQYLIDSGYTIIEKDLVVIDEHISLEENLILESGNHMFFVEQNIHDNHNSKQLNKRLSLFDKNIYTIIWFIIASI